MGSGGGPSLPPKARSAASVASTAAIAQITMVEREPSGTRRTYEAPCYTWEPKVTKGIRLRSPGDLRQRISKPVRPSGSSLVSSTEATSALPGPRSQKETIAATASGSPSKTASTAPSGADW